MASEFPRVKAQLVRRQIEAVLRAWGMDERKIGVTAEVMVQTDLMGIDSHGISMLIMYSQMQEAGQLRLEAEPRIVRQSATTALIDGGASLGHPVSVMGMKLAIEKALAHDIGAVSVFNSHHHGALGYYANMAAEQGLIGMVSSTSRVVNTVPTFGADRVLGTNPFAFAAPAGRNPPVILDMATSVVAANKVKVYALKGKDIPSGWVIDGQGRPVTDADEAFKLLFDLTGVGGLNPIGGDGMDLGGHKAYGLGVFAQIFASTLGGGSFSPIRNRNQKGPGPDNIGHFFLALNPAAFRPIEEFHADMDALIDHLHATRPADPAQPVLVPGDPERISRTDREANGIPMPQSLKDRVRDIAVAAGADYLLDG